MSLDLDLKAEIERRVAAGEVTRCPPQTYALDLSKPQSKDAWKASNQRMSVRARKFEAAEAKRRRMDEAAGALAMAIWRAGSAADSAAS